MPRVSRNARSLLETGIREQPAVLVRGLRRAGKSDLLEVFANDVGDRCVLFDCSDVEHRNQLTNQAAFLRANSGRIVIIDNIELGIASDVSALVRRSVGVVDSPTFIVVASDSHVSSRIAETLHGVLREVLLFPIQPDEASAWNGVEMQDADVGEVPDRIVDADAERVIWSLNTHWLRGGFPESLFARDERSSYEWRRDYWLGVARARYAEWGLQPGDRFEEVLERVVQSNGQQWDYRRCREALDIDRHSVHRAVSVMDYIGLVRLLPTPMTGGCPVIMIRDSGLLHAALGVMELDQLSALQKGHSWESFSTEALCHNFVPGMRPQFYRDKEGNEIDLVLDFRPRVPLCFAIEFKSDEGTLPESGFWQACRVVNPTHRLAIHAGDRHEVLENGLHSLPLIDAIRLVRELAGRA